MYKFTVGIDEYLPQLKMRDFLRNKGISLTEWRRIKAQASIRINDMLVAIDNMPYLQMNDHISIQLPERYNENLAPEKGVLNILFEDEHLVVVSKPANMLIHPTVNQQHGTLGNFVMGYYQQQGYSYGFKPIIRLDRQTSGLVVIAKSARIQHLLSPDKLKKFYLALLPAPSFEKLDVIKPIARKLPSIIEREVNEEYGKYAHTCFTVLERHGDIALVEAELFTGRTHQIRVHAAYLGYPLLGDDIYGGDTTLIKRQALHAYRLEFAHPINGNAIKIIDELPEELSKCLNLSK